MLAHLARPVRGHRLIVVLAFVANLVERSLPRPGLPYPADRHAIRVQHAAVRPPVQAAEPVQHPRRQAGRLDDPLHVKRVIGLLGVAVMHDVDNVVDVRPAPRADKAFGELSARVVAVDETDVLGPLALDEARLHETGGGVAVVLVDFHTAFGNSEVEAAGDHFVAAIAPGLSDPWPDGPGDVEFFEQGVVAQNVFGCGHEKRVQFSRRALQLCQCSLGHPKVLVSVPGRGRERMAHLGDIGGFLRPLRIEPFLRERGILRHFAQLEIEKRRISVGKDLGMCSVVGLQ